MARIRSIKPEIWQDETFGLLPARAQLLFIGLITQADDEGRMRGQPRLIRSQVWPYHDVTDDDVRGWLDDLQKSDMILQYGRRQKSESYIQISNWASHQRINRPSESKFPVPSSHRPIRNVGTEEEDKTRARRAVTEAVKKGDLVRGPCAKCGATEQVHGHHEDYSRPLDVIWLCREHHIEVHGGIGRPYAGDSVRTHGGLSEDSLQDQGSGIKDGKGAAPRERADEAAADKNREKSIALIQRCQTDLGTLWMAVQELADKYEGTATWTLQNVWEPAIRIRLAHRDAITAKALGAAIREVPTHPERFLVKVAASEAERRTRRGITTGRPSGETSGGRTSDTTAAEYDSLTE